MTSKGLESDCSCLQPHTNRLNLSSVNAEKDKSPSGTSANNNTSKDVDEEEVADQSKDIVENGQDEAAESGSKAEESKGMNNNVENNVAKEKEEEDEVEKSNKAEETEAVETVEKKSKDVPNGCSNLKDSNGSEDASPQEKIVQVIFILLEYFLILYNYPDCMKLWTFIFLPMTITFFPFLQGHTGSSVSKKEESTLMAIKGRHKEIRGKGECPDYKEYTWR